MFPTCESTALIQCTNDSPEHKFSAYIKPHDKYLKNSGKKCKEQNSQGPVKYLFFYAHHFTFFNNILNLFYKIQESLEICPCFSIYNLRFSYSEAAARKTDIFIWKWTRFIYMSWIPATSCVLREEPKDYSVHST